MTTNGGDVTMADATQTTSSSQLNSSHTPQPTYTVHPPVIEHQKRDDAHANAPPSHGYAKIVGQEFEHILREKHLQLGRRMPQEKPGLLGVSNAKNISRVHAEINYQLNAKPNGKGAWMMTVIGKNGLLKNEQFQPANESFPIEHRDRITIGDSTFFFLEPIQTGQ